MTYSNKKRITAGLVALVMFFFVILSVSFMAHEADHECTGDDCPVCALIQLCGDSLRQIGSGVAEAVSAITVAVIFILILSVSEADDLLFSTPVSRKTRLNN